MRTETLAPDYKALLPIIEGNLSDVGTVLDSVRNNTEGLEDWERLTIINLLMNKQVELRKTIKEIQDAHQYTDTDSDLQE